MKHVWILNHYAATPSSSGVTRTYNFAKNLPPCGWTASIIAASTDYHTRKQYLKDGETSRIEEINGVPFLFLRTPPYQRNDWRRAVNMLVFMARALTPGMMKGLQKPDVIIGSSVHPFAAIAGAVLAACRHVPFVFEVRDLWPQTLIDMGYLKPDGFVTRALQLVEKWLYRRAVRIVVLLEHADNYIVPLGIAKNKIVWIPNGVDSSVFPVAREVAPSGVFTLMYFGAHGDANGLHNVLAAMKILNQKTLPMPVRLRLIGDGPEKVGLIARAKEAGLGNVSFEDPVPKTEIPALAAQADVFLFNVRNLDLFKYGMSPNKLFDYFAAARPIVYTGATRDNMVELAQAGLTVPPEDPQAMADAIARLMALTPAERAEMGRNGRRYVEEKHAFSYLAQKLATVLDQCAG